MRAGLCWKSLQDNNEPNNASGGNEPCRLAVRKGIHKQKNHLWFLNHLAAGVLSEENEINFMLYNPLFHSWEQKMFCVVCLPFLTFLEALSAQVIMSSSAVLRLLSVLGSHTQWSQGLPGRLQKFWRRRRGWDGHWDPERAVEGKSRDQ